MNYDYIFVLPINYFFLYLVMIIYKMDLLILILFEYLVYLFIFLVLYELYKNKILIDRGIFVFFFFNKSFQRFILY